VCPVINASICYKWTNDSSEWVVSPHIMSVVMHS